MKKKIVFNPLSGEFDLIGHIPELTSDPSSPAPEDAWVLRSGSGGVGSGESYGLLLALTQPGTGGSYTYALKYRTQEGTTISVALS